MSFLLSHTTKAFTGICSNSMQSKLTVAVDLICSEFEQISVIQLICVVVVTCITRSRSDSKLPHGRGTLCDHERTEEVVTVDGRHGLRSSSTCVVCRESDLS